MPRFTPPINTFAVLGVNHEATGSTGLYIPGSHTRIWYSIHHNMGGVGKNTTWYQVLITMKNNHVTTYHATKTMYTSTMVIGRRIELHKNG